MKTRLPLVLLSVLALSAAAASAQAPAAISDQLKPELIFQTRHTDSVYALAFSPDGRLLASGSADRTVKLWHAATGLQLRTYSGHSEEVYAVAFSPDGRWLASASADKTIKLWDVTTGRELRTLTGHNHGVVAVAFGPDGRWLASGSKDQIVKLWEVSTGREVRTLAGHAISELGSLVASFAVVFSPDGLWLASGGWDRTIKVWEVATGRELRTITGHKGHVTSVAFSPDGRTLASGSEDRTVKLWDVATGGELRTFVGHTSEVGAVVFSTDGGLLASGGWSEKKLKLWDVATGRELRALVGHTKGNRALAFSPDGRWFASASADKTVKLWEVVTWRQVDASTGRTMRLHRVAWSPDGHWLAAGSDNGEVKLCNLSAGRELTRLSGHRAVIWGLAFSPNSRWLASASWDKMIKIWDVATGQELRTLMGHNGSVYAVAFSRDGRWLASASDDATVKLWDVATWQELRTLAGHAEAVWSVAFSPDGRTLASASEDETVKLWDVATGRELRTLKGHGGWVLCVIFSPDGRLLASGSADQTVKLWEVTTGRARRTLAGHTYAVESVAFSPDNHWLASGSGDDTIKVWEAETGRERRTLVGHIDRVTAVIFSPTGERLASASLDGSIGIWDVAGGKELLRVVALSNSDWAVVDPEGRFDASPGGMKLMHWVVGLEPIALDQLKQRYYEPGLLAKIFGYNKEPLRDVSAFTSVALYPEVETLGSVEENGKLKIKLKNRGGGIGRIQVFVNDKELTADARGPKPDPTAQETTVTVDLAGAPAVRGKPNQIRVVAWNQEGYLSSRGQKGLWRPKGTPDERPPELYAIVSGISNYAAPEIQLRFASKDAEDMARALELGGRRLFGAARVHLTVLSTSGNAGVQAPTKANLKKAFEAAQAAKPSDVLVVYLAGHGVAVRDTYVYPTQEARSLNLSDPAIREQTGITSEELTDWIKKVPALHQVMILDTCNAGAAAVKLAEKRDVPGDQIRALDRLKDRTGFHVLMGSAADASSYEATQYGQGLLTYTLLQGMRGAALKNDVDVDVSQLFQCAADKVPALARNVGGIQRPEIFAPQGASFDVGQLSKEDRAAIPLAMVKPLILRPVVINPEEGGDNLGLMALLRKRLRDDSYASARGDSRQPAAIFVDEEEFPGAIRPWATYSVEGKKVTVKLILRRDAEKLATLQVEGSSDDPAALVSKMADAITQAIQKP